MPEREVGSGEHCGKSGMASVAFRNQLSLLAGKSVWTQSALGPWSVCQDFLLQLISSRLSEHSFLFIPPLHTCHLLLVKIRDHFANDAAISWNISSFHHLKGVHLTFPSKFRKDDHEWHTHGVEFLFPCFFPCFLLLFSSYFLNYIAFSFIFSRAVFPITVKTLQWENQDAPRKVISSDLSPWKDPLISTLYWFAESLSFYLKALGFSERNWCLYKRISQRRGLYFLYQPSDESLGMGEPFQ